MKGWCERWEGKKWVYNTYKDWQLLSDIISYLNEKTNAAYRPDAKKTEALITVRWNERFGLENFKRVIDLKTAEWLHDPIWNKYLRPETLFGTRFESYLNQKTGKKTWREEDFDLDDQEDIPIIKPDRSV